MSSDAVGVEVLDFVDAFEWCELDFSRGQWVPMWMCSEHSSDATDMSAIMPLSTKQKTHSQPRKKLQVFSDKKMKINTIADSGQKT